MQFECASQSFVCTELDQCGCAEVVEPEEDGLVEGVCTSLGEPLLGVNVVLREPQLRYP